MAALPKAIPEHDFKYYADASVFRAEITEPTVIKTDNRYLIELAGVKPGYRYVPAEPLPKGQGIFSFESGYAQVAGHPSTKVKGYATLATGVLEGLNVLDVLTADRVVGQISTVYPEGGAVPSVTFLGTRFENLRISGRKVEIELDLDIFGSKPVDDGSYFDDSGVLSRIAQQYDSINGVPNLPSWAGKQFNWSPATVQNGNKMNCALVNRVSGSPGTCFGHVIDLPDFGRIFLGEIGLKRTPYPNYPDSYTYMFSLEMIRLELGCLADGTSTMIALETNGVGQPPPPGPLPVPDTAPPPQDAH